MMADKKQAAWKLAKRLADNVKVLKNTAAKRRQIVLWCQMVKKAMKGDNAEPVLRNGTTRARPMNAAGPSAST